MTYEISFHIFTDFVFHLQDISILKSPLLSLLEFIRKFLLRFKYRKFVKINKDIINSLENQVFKDFVLRHYSNDTCVSNDKYTESCKDLEGNLTSINQSPKENSERVVNNSNIYADLPKDISKSSKYSDISIDLPKDTSESSNSNIQGDCTFDTTPFHTRNMAKIDGYINDKFKTEFHKILRKIPNTILSKAKDLIEHFIDYPYICYTICIFLLKYQDFEPTFHYNDTNRCRVYVDRFLHPQTKIASLEYSLFNRHRIETYRGAHYIEQASTNRRNISDGKNAQSENTDIVRGNVSGSVENLDTIKNQFRREDQSSTFKIAKYEENIKHTNRRNYVDPSYYPTSIFLDVGGGTGISSNALAICSQRFLNNSYIICSDISVNSLIYARENEANYIRPKVGDILDSMGNIGTKNLKVNDSNMEMGKDKKSSTESLIITSNDTTLKDKKTLKADESSTESLHIDDSKCEKSLGHSISLDTYNQISYTSEKTSLDINSQTSRKKRERNNELMTNLIDYVAFDANSQLWPFRTSFTCEFATSSAHFFCKTRYSTIFNRNLNTLKILNFSPFSMDEVSVMYRVLNECNIMNANSIMSDEGKLYTNNYTMDENNNVSISSTSNLNTPPSSNNISSHIVWRLFATVDTKKQFNFSNLKWFIINNGKHDKYGQCLMTLLISHNFISKLEDIIYRGDKGNDIDDFEKDNNFSHRTLNTGNNSSHILHNNTNNSSHIALNDNDEDVNLNNNNKGFTSPLKCISHLGISCLQCIKHDYYIDDIHLKFIDKISRILRHFTSIDLLYRYMPNDVWSKYVENLLYKIKNNIEIKFNDLHM